MEKSYSPVRNLLTYLFITEFIVKSNFADKQINSQTPKFAVDCAAIGIGSATGLSDIELRSAVLLAILSFIVYPVLPAHPVDPFGLVQLQETWATVLLIAALGFVNYVLWKIYGPRSIDITSFLGGLVNSTAAVAELSSRVREAGEAFVKLAYRGVVLATGAMLLRIR